MVDNDAALALCLPREACEAACDMLEDCVSIDISGKSTAKKGQARSQYCGRKVRRGDAKKSAALACSFTVSAFAERLQTELPHMYSF